MKEPCRILVLTSASGGGHDSQAQAFADWARLGHGDSVEVRIEHMLEDSSAFQKSCVDFYNFIQRRAPWFHHAFYQWTEFLSVLNSDKVSLGRDYFCNMLEAWRPDVVLSVHDCLNRGYFEEARRVLGDGVKCVTYCPEFEGGFGFSRGWVNPTADLFIARTVETAETAARFGLPNGRSVSGGNLIGPRFFSEVMSENDRARWLREAVGFDAGKFTLLLATGGAGAQNHIAVLEQLAGAELQAIALCGRDEGMRTQLEQWHRRHPEFALHIMPFTDQMPELMRACSMIFTRAGSTAAEALHCGCPVVFNTIGTAMPHEMPTIRWFRRRGVARTAFTASRLAQIVRQFLADPRDFEEWRTRFRACEIPGNPAEIVSHVLALRANR